MFVGSQGRRRQRDLGLKGEKGERRMGVERNRVFELDSVCVGEDERGSGRERYGGSCKLCKAGLRRRLDTFEGGLKSEGTHKPR